MRSKIHVKRLIAKDRRRKRSGDLLRLEVLNACPRDRRIVFDEEAHTYQLDSAVTFPVSVSSVWNFFFEEMDMDETCHTYFSRWSQNPSSKYYATIAKGRVDGLSDQAIMAGIVEAWRDTGRQASAQGTYMHRQIELFLNCMECDDSLPEMEQFKSFMLDFALPRRLEPFRTEWSIFDEDHMVAGQIDSIFKCIDAEVYYMIDWKRCAKPLDPHAGAFFNKYGHPPM